MAWEILNGTNNPGPEQATFFVEEFSPDYTYGIKLPNVYSGFSTGTIHNPTYGSGIDYPLRGVPTYDRGESIANRRYSGIIYP